MKRTFRLGSLVLSLLASLVGCTDSGSSDDSTEQPSGDDDSDMPDAPPALPAGALDTSFGTNGIFTLPTSGFAGDIAAQGDKLVVCANELENGVVTARIYRYDTNGVLDTTFGTEGRVSMVVASAWTYCKDLVVTSDSIYAVVTATYPMNQEGSFIRQYSKDGELLHTANSSSDTHITALANDTIASSGLVGNMAEASILSPSLSGMHVYSAETGAIAATRAFQFNGKLAVVSQFDNNGAFTTLLVQDDASNELVDSVEQRAGFGMQNLPDYVLDAAQLADGSIFAVGSIDYAAETMAIRWAHGTQTEQFNEHHAIDDGAMSQGIALDQAGRPVVVGVSYVGEQTKFMWQRYALNSVTLDASYQGVKTLSVPDGNGALYAATELGGSIYALGSINHGGSNSHVVILKIAE